MGVKLAILLCSKFCKLLPIHSCIKVQDKVLFYWNTLKPIFFNLYKQWLIGLFHWPIWSNDASFPTKPSQAPGDKYVVFLKWKYTLFLKTITKSFFHTKVYYTVGRNHASMRRRFSNQEFDFLISINQH